jgi:hypothetical protein
MNSATEWAQALIDAGADMAAVNRELDAALIIPQQKLAQAVRDEFIRLTLANMEAAKRGREQYKGWKNNA